jgi:hypothetical protein
MWEPGCLTTLWTFTASYRDNFTSPFSEKIESPVVGEMSRPRDIQAGVPQRSVLSPTLYYIYIYMIRPKHLGSIYVFLLMTPVYMRRTAKRAMFLERNSEVSVLLRRGVSAAT